MKRIVELAERLGLVDLERIEAIVLGAPVDVFCKIVELTTRAVLEDERDAVDGTGTAVLASSSIRSDSGCRCWDCRATKLQALARYACLYADRLILPISFTTMLTDEEPARYAVADLFYKVNVLRPLLDAGIAVLAPDIHCFCLKCGRTFDNLCDQFDAASFQTYLEKVGSGIEVVYRPPARGRSWYVELNGPREYIPNGHLIIQPVGDYARKPKWAPKRFRRIGGRFGSVLSPERIRKHRIAGTHFGQLARDAVVQQYSGVRYDASYVTDSPVEAAFLERVYPRDDIALNAKLLLDEIGHEVPLLMDLPLRRILRLRREDYDSFASYRATLRQVLRDNLQGRPGMDSSTARELCADVILPQVRKLQSESKAKRRSAMRKAVAGVGAVAAALGVGVVAGMVRPELERIFQIGGIALAGKLGDVLAAIEKHPAEVRSHNMYFLLRLINESD